MNRPPPKPRPSAIFDASLDASTALPDLARASAAFVGALVPRRGRLLVAVSGGTDSTALAVVMAHLQHRCSWPFACVLAHVDHRTQPTSAAVAAGVRALAARLHLGHLEQRLPAGTGRSEAALREARYRALRSMAVHCGAVAICTAHTADDQIETVLFRAVRGTGPRGLAGIPPVRGLGPDLLLLRPFLATRRATLSRMLADLGEPPFEDPSNRDLRYARNRIRHVLLPKLRARVQRFDASVLELAARARRVTDALTARAMTRLAAGSETRPARLQLRAEAATPGPLCREMLRLAHQRLRPGSNAPWSWIVRAAELLARDAGTRVDGPGRLLAERIRDGLLLIDTERCGAPPTAPCDLEPGAAVRFGDTEWRVQLAPTAAAPPLYADRDRAVIDAAVGRLRLRSRRPGDRFRPLGMTTAVELRRFLQARHVPRFDRDRLPLVVDADDRVVWVPGVEIAAGAAIGAATRAAVELRLRGG